VLAREPTAQIALVYANRDANDVIFAKALDDLAREHASRFTLLRVTGLLDRRAAIAARDAVPHASHAAARFFVCGPDGMRDEVLAALAARGVAEDAIAIERFTIGPRPHVAASAASIAAVTSPGARPVAIRIDGRTHRTTALPGATVLEAGLAAGAPMPFSCAVGGCGACKLKVLEGSVEVEEPNCLTAAERAAGFVLACVGRPCGPCVLERVEETTARGGA
jgi:ferredoxin